MRTISVPSRVYQPGPIGPFGLDSFTKDDASGIVVEMTVEAWPDVPVVAKVVVQTGSGARMEVNVPGRPFARDRVTPATVFRISLAFPSDGSVNDGVVQPAEKRQTTNATVTAEVLVAMRTAITAWAA